MNKYYEADGITIYHGDCLDVLPQLKKVDLVLTDPPYGIDYNAEKLNLKTSQSYGDITNDTGDFDFSSIFEIDACLVVFGANCFPHLLPVRGRWICWYKRGEGADKALGSPFELAWESRMSGYDKFYKVVHGGFVNSDGGKRYHPTQKPVKLFKMILNDYPKANTILDPFIGSGTTLVAAKQLGRKAIGIEIEEKYCEIAVKRLAQRELF